MAVEVFELFSALSNHHVPNMDATHQRALLLRVAGRSDKDAAESELASPTTLKNRLNIASAEIALCLPADQRLRPDQRGYWLGCHLECCLAAALRALGEAAG